MSDRPETTPSEAAKELAATIVKRANEGVYQRLGVRVGFAPTGLETLIQMYFDDERKAGRREMASETQIDWLPIGSAAPGDVLQMAKYVSPPALGQHIGKVRTLPDGRWLVLKFSNTKPQAYFILPVPPL